MTQNPNNLDIIASGQVATIVNRHSTNPHICIWNSKTNEQWILPALHKRAIRTLAFSTCGTYLASVGNDNSQEMIIWDWQNKSKISSCKTISLPKKVFQIVWSNNNQEIMLVGMKSLILFNFNNNKVTKHNKSIKLRKLYKKQSIYSVISISSHEYIICNKDGTIYIIKNGQAIKQIQVSKASCFAMAYNANTSRYIIGTKDGTLDVYNSKTHEEIVKHDQKFDTSIRAIAITPKGRYIIGTKSGCIYYLKNINKSPKLLVKGHYDGELWALDTDPNNHGYFATAGEDNAINLWHAPSHKFLTSGIISNKKGKRSKSDTLASTTSTYLHGNVLELAHFHQI